MQLAPARTDASQQTLVAALPPVLVLHLKRFSYDRGAGGVAKLAKRVAFGAELVLGADVVAGAGARFKLYGGAWPPLAWWCGC